MKNPDTLDTLIASKEQTDKAIAELANELREKLNRLEAVIGRPQAALGGDRLQTADGSRGATAPPASAVVSKLPSAVYYGIAVVVLVGVFLFGQYFGDDHSSTPDPVPMPIPAPAGLTMTQREAELVRQAIDLVREDVDGLQTTARVRDALWSHLPSRVRDTVMNEFGEPDMEFMRDALDILEGKLPK